MKRSKAGQLKPDEWQRDYFLGRDASGRQAAPVHMTKVKPPKVSYAGTAAPPSAGNGSCVATRPTRDAITNPNKRQRVPRGPVVTPENAASSEADSAPVFRPINDEWRRWISENLMLGASEASILKTMVKGGLSPSQSASEIGLAATSPYLKGAERVCNRLKKREWLLATYRKLNRLRPRSVEIERRHKLAHDEFLEDYYCTNRPVIITGMMDDWPALGKWSLAYFAQKFGDREVEVQIGRETSGNFEVERERFRRKMVFSSTSRK